MPMPTRSDPTIRREFMGNVPASANKVSACAAAVVESDGGDASEGGIRRHDAR